MVTGHTHAANTITMKHLTVDKLDMLNTVFPQKNNRRRHRRRGHIINSFRVFMVHQSDGVGPPRLIAAHRPITPTSNSRACAKQRSIDIKMR